jgi:hypothetical protein
VLSLSETNTIGYYIQVTGQCSAASVYTYETGGFEKQGDTWIEYSYTKEKKPYATYTKRLEDAQFVYIADPNRQSQGRTFFVRIPKCGGQVDWTLSNPLDWQPWQPLDGQPWQPFHLVTRPPLNWYDHIVAAFGVLKRWIGSPGPGQG